MFSRLLSRANAGDVRAGFLDVFGHVLRVDHDGRVEITEENDEADVGQLVDQRARRVQVDVDEASESAGESVNWPIVSGNMQQRRREDRRNDTGGIYPQREIAHAALLDALAHDAPRMLNREFGAGPRSTTTTNPDDTNTPQSRPKEERTEACVN